MQEPGDNRRTSSKIHPDLKVQYPLVAWREMNDIRNRIIHEYFGVDHQIIWNTVISDIPGLKEWTEIIIEEEIRRQ